MCRVINMNLEGGNSISGSRVRVFDICSECGVVVRDEHQTFLEGFFTSASLCCMCTVAAAWIFDVQVRTWQTDNSYLQL